MNNKIEFIKADDNKIINENCIKCVKKLDECLYICTKSTECDFYTNCSTHKICKLNNPNSYNKLNELLYYKKI